MDLLNMSIIKIGDELVDITELPVVGLAQGREGKAIIKQLPTMPLVECCKIECGDLAAHLVQYVGDDLTFSHQFCCARHTDELKNLVKEDYGTATARATNACN